MIKYYFIVCTITFIAGQTNGLCKFGATTICENNTTLTCNFSKPTTDLRYIYNENNANAEYTVNFIAFENACGFNYYDITVDLINAVEDQSDCKYDDRNLDSEKTLHRFRVDNQNNSVCSKLNLSFCMMYWFSGCYSFTITPYLGHNSYRPVVYFIWLKNNYTLADFDIISPTFIYFNYENNVEIQWKFNSRTIRDNSAEYSVHLDQYHDNSIETVFYMQELTNNCTLKEEKVICQCGNIPQGNYSIHFKLKDDWRCKVHYGIFKNCDWTAQMERYVYPNASKYTLKASVIPNNLYIGIIAGSSILLIGIISTISWFIYKKRNMRHNWNQNNKTHPCPDVQCHLKSSPQTKGIFLLYARDCQPFMDAMIELRNVLANLTGCKIYDLFDDSLFNEIAVSPNEFVQSLIQDPNIKVVVVASECAEKLYQFLMNYYSQPINSDKECMPLMQSYSLPNWLDGLVIYSLKMISFDVSPAPYHKFFVIRIPKFDRRNDYLSHINPFKRFDIPDGLEILVDNLSLHHSQNSIIVNSDNSSIGKVSFYSEAKREQLNTALRNLYNFAQNNPRYLMTDILNENYL